MNDEQLAKIKQAATNATQGEWDIERDPMHFDTASTVVGGNKTAKWSHRELIVQIGGSSGVVKQEANAAFIATANPSAVLELIDRLEAAERDAAKWQAYQKRKQEVIAAGMGRKIMRDTESYDALPAFYAAMKEKP